MQENRKNGKEKVMRGLNCRGLSYLEVLVAVALLAICLVPVLEALQPAMLGTSISESYVMDQARLQSRFEEVLAEPFSALEAAATAAGSPTVATGYSDAPGTEERLLVFIGAADGDNADGDNNPFTGMDADLLWVRVEMDSSGHVRECLVSRY
jgi:hypothetical protein